MYCDVELAARIERAERTLIESACAIVAERSPTTRVVPISGGIAAYTEPGSPLNKVVGLGFAGGIDERALAHVESAHDAVGAPVQAEVSTLADPRVAGALTRRGYAMVGVENVLGLALPARLADAPRDVSVDRIDEREHDAWLDAVVTGFASPDAIGVPAHEEYDRGVLERVVRDMSRAAGMSMVLARIDGRAVGGASMRASDGIAQLCGAATVPAARRRGVQSALLRRRLDDAARAGCDLAVITTSPGSKSQANAHRAGFALLYARVVLVREPRAGSAPSEPA